MNQQQQPQLNIDLKNTKSIETPDGNKIFQQGVLLREVSKFVIGSEENAVLPVPIFYDPKTMKIVESTIPAELREEYKDHILLQ